MELFVFFWILTAHIHHSVQYTFFIDCDHKFSTLIFQILSILSGHSFNKSYFGYVQIFPSSLLMCQKNTNKHLLFLAIAQPCFNPRKTLISCLRFSNKTDEGVMAIFPLLCHLSPY